MVGGWVGGIDKHLKPKYVPDESCFIKYRYHQAIPAPHTTVSSVDIVTGGISGVLVGAMATLVDTVANVVQSAKGSPKAEYHNGMVEVKIPVSNRYRFDMTL